MAQRVVLDANVWVSAAAFPGRVDAIVTGDRKHLLPLGHYEGIPIVSPRDFIEAVDPR